jgi:hypothetical protein
MRAILYRRNEAISIEDSLDVVDRRTLAGLLKRAGYVRGDPSEIPATIGEFLDCQTLVSDHRAINQLKEAFNRHDVS